MRGMTTFLYRYRLEGIAALMTLCAASAVFLFSDLRFPNDDQFITYRYIENIAEGKGFVYNEGETILIATAPLFVLIAALAKSILPAASTPDIVAYLNILFLSIASVFFLRLARRLVPDPVAITGAAVFALNMSRTIPEGMEAPLFILLLLSLLDRLLAARYMSAAILLPLVFFTRPDAILIAALAVVYVYLKSDIWTALRFGSVSGLVALPWLLFATLHFGSFVPQSILTKLHAHDIYHLAPLQALKIQLAALSRIFWGKLFDPANIPLQTIVNLMPFIALLAFGAWRKVSRDTWIIFAIPLAYFLFFSMANPLMFPWYVSEMEPLWTLAVFAGVGAIIAIAKKRLLATAVIVLLLAGPLYGWVSALTTTNQGSKMHAFEMASFIQARMQEGDSIGLADIGIVGYVTKARIVDFIGLVDPASVAYYPILDPCVDRGRFYTVPPALVRATQPEWVIGAVDQMSPCLLRSDWFSEQYEEVYAHGGARIWKLKEK